MLFFIKINYKYLFIYTLYLFLIKSKLKKKQIKPDRMSMIIDIND